MRGTSFSGDKLTGDFGKELEDRFIGNGTNLYFLTKKLVPNHFGLLQQYRPFPAIQFHTARHKKAGTKR
jgi:hypothetical protein